MGFRFQRRIRIAPGLTLNITHRGVSASVGVRGARMTFGNGRQRTTLGVPGTGLSYSEVTRTGGASRVTTWIGFIVIGFFVLAWLLS